MGSKTGVITCATNCQAQKDGCTLRFALSLATSHSRCCSQQWLHLQLMPLHYHTNQEAKHQRHTRTDINITTSVCEFQISVEIKSEALSESDSGTEIRACPSVCRSPRGS